jgi:hypothetical protein
MYRVHLRQGAMSWYVVGSSTAEFSIKIHAPETILQLISNEVTHYGGETEIATRIQIRKGDSRWGNLFWLLIWDTCAGESTQTERGQPNNAAQNFLQD